MVVAALYVSILTAMIVPADRWLVAGSNLGDLWSSLYYVSASLQMDLLCLCLVLKTCISVDLVGALSMCCRYRIMLCIRRVLNVTSFMAG